MKKIILVILSVAILTSLYPSMGISVMADISANDMLVDEMTAVFDYIDVYPTPEGGISNDIAMTRGDFCAYTAKALKLTENDNNVYFSDVPRSHSNVSYINALADYGIVSKGTEEFRPDGAISEEEAIKIVVSAIGYSTVAELEGGWPNGYINTAGRLRIIPKITNPLNLTHKEAMLLLYNGLIAETYSLSGASKGNVVYEKSGETSLETVWNITRASGMLNAFYGGSLDGNTVEKNGMRIGNENFECLDAIYPDDMFANTVDFTYIKRENEGKNPLILWICNADNNDCIIDANGIEEFDEESYAIKYYASENSSKPKTERFERNAKIYYNGALYTGSVSGIMNEFIHDKKKGVIRLKDMDESGAYDTVIIKSYRNVAVRQVNYNGDIYYNMADSTDSIDKSAYHNVTVRTPSGKNAALTINDTTVLTIAESKDYEYLEIIVCDDIVIGNVLSVGSKDDGECNVGLADRKLKLDASYPKKFPPIACNTEYKFIIDKFGYIAYAEAITNSDKNVALIISYYIGDEIMGEIEGGLKLLTSKNEIKVYPFASKVKVDGVTYSKAQRVYDVLGSLPGTNTDYLYSRENTNLAVRKQAIRYVINDKDELIEIDSSNVGGKEDSRNTLTEIENPTHASRFIQRYTATTARFGANMLYSPNNTTVFCMPRTDDEGYLITSRTDTGVQNPSVEYVLDNAGNKMKPTDSLYTIDFYVHTDNWTEMKGYRLSDSSPYTDVIVIKYEPYINSNESLLFEELFEGINEDDDIVTFVRCWYRNQSVAYEVCDPSDFDEMVKGDLFRCAYDETKKKIKYVTKIYDHITDEFKNGTRVPGENVGISNTVITPDYWYNGTITLDNKSGMATGWGYYNSLNLTKGAVTNKSGNVIFWDWDKDLTTYEECLDFTAVPIMIIDDENNIRVGSINDVVDYKSGGDSCSRIVFFSQYMIGRCGYVYTR